MKLSKATKTLATAFIESIPGGMGIYVRTYAKSHNCSEAEALCRAIMLLRTNVLLLEKKD